MGSCFFIGHRETPDRVYPTLLETIERHITEYGVSEFVVGQYGSFDRLVIRALSQAKRTHPDITLMSSTPNRSPRPTHTLQNNTANTHIWCQLQLTMILNRHPAKFCNFNL